MSILSSTNSGIQTKLTEEFLLSTGWELSVELTSVKIYKYVPKILQADMPLYVTFNNKLDQYLYRGKYQNMNIDFLITTIGELQELITYYFNELKDPEKAFLKIKNNKNVEISLHYESELWTNNSVANKFYKDYN